MEGKIIKRIFIIGIARSGTTLLQSMIGSHPSVFTLPETHFWDHKLFKQKFLRALQVINEKDEQFVNEYFSKTGYGQKIKWPTPFFSKKQYTRYLIKEIDKLAFENEKKIWVEKTPLNLYYINLISSVFPDTYFLHTIRNGIDNIASLYEASTNNPQYFAQSTIDKCINRYRKEIRISKKYLGKQNHHFVLYDELVGKPKETLELLCSFLGINFKEEMLDYSNTAQNIILPEESWKNKNISKLGKSSKKDKLFTKDQISNIAERVKDISLNEFKFAK